MVVSENTKLKILNNNNQQQLIDIKNIIVVAIMWGEQSQRKKL